MYVISKSLIRDFYYKGHMRDYCHTKLKAVHFENAKTIPTIYMTRGLYFETKAIGGSARGEAVHDLPRKRITKKQKAEGITIGDKGIDQERIDLQVLNFKRQVNEFNMHLIPGQNTQVRIFKKYQDKYGFNDILLSGELDWFPVVFDHPDYGQIMAIIDLKLAGNIMSTWGEFSYANPGSLDRTESQMYYELARDIDIPFNMKMNKDTKLPNLITPEIADYINNGNLYFFLWVFDYTIGKNHPKLLDTFIEFKDTPVDRGELAETLRKVRSKLIELEEMTETPMHPTDENCKGCPVTGCIHNNVFVEPTPEAPDKFQVT